jgi:hypothetical protein
MCEARRPTSATSSPVNPLGVSVRCRQAHPSTLAAHERGAQLVTELNRCHHRAVAADSIRTLMPHAQNTGGPKGLGHTVHYSWPTGPRNIGA